ncbi:phosphatase [Aspergillus terreus]|uniref:Phosphatase n=1 Tax=Aspergillus terreus TaxID=33178 RepID=A0A5M3Z4L8_ASPTE|nr:hypothetical protein ATETN484_0007022400 [Aspergillus terreus]GFF16029.1 phosphatase [Aspergillus terreus]
MAQNKITEIEGDLFSAPDGAGLIHACNCEGSWGGGIAKAFREKVWIHPIPVFELLNDSISQYPTAYKIYHEHCKKYQSKPEYKDVPSESTTSRQVKLPEGTALFIPPQDKDTKKGSKGPKGHWIICLFTSPGYGKKVSPPDVILQNTRLAVADMKRQVDELGADIGELWSCRFNSGLFKVEWELSRKILEEFDLKVTVVRPEGESE